MNTLKVFGIIATVIVCIVMLVTWLQYALFYGWFNHASLFAIVGYCTAPVIVVTLTICAVRAIYKSEN